MAIQETWQKLRDMIDQKSFLKEGDFKLASGAESSFFFDMKPTMLDPGGASFVAELILDKIKDETSVTAVAGLELGACPIVSTVSLKSFETNNPITGLYVRKTPKKRGTQKMVEGKNLTANDHVVVVEDVSTSGGSALQAAEEIKKLGANIACIISIVDREQGARARIEGEGYVFHSLFTKDDFSTKT